MWFTHGWVDIADHQEVSSLSYGKFVPQERTPGIYQALRKYKGRSKWVMIRNMIIHWDYPPGRYYLSKSIAKLPSDFIKHLYEFGLEIILLHGEEAKKETVRYFKRNLQIKLLPFLDVNYAGFYYQEGRLLILNDTAIARSEYNISIYYLAKCYRDAVLSFPDIKTVPDYNMSYTNKFAPYLIIKYADKKGEDYFPVSLERFYDPEGSIKLKESDRVMYELLSTWISNMFDEKPLLNSEKNPYVW